MYVRYLCLYLWTVYVRRYTELELHAAGCAPEPYLEGSPRPSALALRYVGRRYTSRVRSKVRTLRVGSY